MADLNDLQTALTVKIAGSDSSGTEDFYVNADSNGQLLVKDASDGSVVPGTVAANSSLIGGQYNTTLPTLTNTQQSSIQLDSRGRLIATVNQAKFTSVVNSSTANLASLATFTGTGESTYTFNAIQINFISDKNCQVQCQQSMDNTNWDIVDIFDTTASKGDSRTIQVTALFCRVLVTNNDLLTSTFLRLQTIYVPLGDSLPRSVADNGKLSITYVAPNGTPGMAHGKVTTGTISVVRNTSYTEQTTNAQRSVVSSSASDSAAGTGARTIRITYLDQNNRGFFTEDITLNGTTAVNTVNTNICYVEKIEVLSTGSFGANIGTISIKTTTGGGGTTFFSIAIGDNTTFQCHHYIPAGKIGYIQAIHVSCASTTALFYFIWSNDLTNFNTGRIDEIQCPASSSFTRRYENPIPITAGMHVTVLVNATGSSTYYATIEYFDV